MSTLSDLITPAVVAEICRRSAEGEGVVAVIADMGLPVETIVYLRDNHHAEIVAAKQEQLRKRDAD